jgi:hypothetical protein
MLVVAVEVLMRLVRPGLLVVELVVVAQVVFHALRQVLLVQ